MTVIRRFASTPFEAERKVRSMVIEMMLLAVMPGLLDVRSAVPRSTNNGTGRLPKNTRAVPSTLSFSGNPRSAPCRIHDPEITTGRAAPARIY